MTLYDNKILDCDTLKAMVDHYRPLKGYTLAQLRQYYRIGLTYTSNALEGNTLTESETKVVLEEGLTVAGKPMKDHLATLGHAKAYDYLYDLLDQPTLTEANLLHLHGLVVEGLDKANPGQYRPMPVIITGTTYVPPQPTAVPQQMATLLTAQLPQWQHTQHPIEVAALAHLHLVTIHPFMDGNGRTARLLMNVLLLKAGYTITLIPPVVRADYMACLRQFQENGDSTPFLHFISAMVHQSAQDYCRLLKHLHPDIAFNKP
jgi:Fic family protein